MEDSLDEAVRFEAGDGLCLASLTAADAVSLAAVIREDADLLAQWLPHLVKLKSPARVRAHLRRVAPYAARLCWLDLTIREHDRVVGFISLYGVDRHDGLALVGYWVASSHTGRGIATRALTALCDYAFGEYGLHRLELQIAVDNGPSRAVAERVGFRCEGVLRERFARGASYVDGALYARISGDR